MSSKPVLELTSRIVVTSPNKSKSKILDVCDSYPCELLLSLPIQQQYNKDQVLISSISTGQKAYSHVGTLGAVLKSIDYEVI